MNPLLYQLSYAAIGRGRCGAGDVVEDNNHTAFDKFGSPGGSG